MYKRLKFFFRLFTCQFKSIKSCVFIKQNQGRSLTMILRFNEPSHVMNTLNIFFDKMNKQFQLTLTCTCFQNMRLAWKNRNMIDLWLKLVLDGTYWIFNLIEISLDLWFIKINNIFLSTITWSIAMISFLANWHFILF